MILDDASAYPRRKPTGAKPTLTPVKNKVNPTYEYISPTTIRMTWVFFNLIANTWKITNMAATGAILSATSLRFVKNPKPNAFIISANVCIASSGAEGLTSPSLPVNPTISIAKNGPTVQSATDPKFSSPSESFLPCATVAMPTVKAIKNGTVTAPVDTPPLSRATVTNSGVINSITPAIMKIMPYIARNTYRSCHLKKILSIEIIRNSPNPKETNTVIINCVDLVSVIKLVKT